MVKSAFLKYTLYVFWHLFIKYVSAPYIVFIYIHFQVKSYMWHRSFYGHNVAGYWQGPSCLHLWFQKRASFRYWKQCRVAKGQTIYFFFALLSRQLTRKASEEHRAAHPSWKKWTKATGCSFTWLVLHTAENAITTPASWPPESRTLLSEFKMSFTPAPHILCAALRRWLYFSLMHVHKSASSQTTAAQHFARIPLFVQLFIFIALPRQLSVVRAPVWKYKSWIRKLPVLLQVKFCPVDPEITQRHASSVARSFIMINAGTVVNLESI